MTYAVTAGRIRLSCLQHVIGLGRGSTEGHCRESQDVCPGSSSSATEDWWPNIRIFRGHNTSIDKMGDYPSSPGMARLARLVIPGLPHHVTQRGNRRQQTFFNDGDYAAYLELMSEWCREEALEREWRLGPIA